MRRIRESPVTAGVASGACVASKQADARAGKRTTVKDNRAPPCSASTWRDERNGNGARTELSRRRKNKTRCAVVWDTPPARIDADTVGLTGVGHIEVVANNPLPDAPLAEVWQAVDKFTSDPRARNMRLPALKGAPRGNKPWGNW